MYDNEKVQKLTTLVNELTQPFAMYGGKLHHDRNNKRWLAYVGQNHEVGFSAVGSNPMLAIKQFNKQWRIYDEALNR